MLKKAQIRRQMKEKRNALHSNEIKTKSDKIFQQIEKLDFFSSVDNVLVYVSYQSEVYTHDFIKKCLFLQKNVFVPKVYGKTMHFIQIESMNDLAEGSYGILEPVKDAPIWDENRIKTVEPQTTSPQTIVLPKAIMILPALAVDRRGNRLGYGGGYYDKYLKYENTSIRSDINNMIKIAVVFDFQVLSELPTEETDKKVDDIVTEYNIYKEKIWIQ